MEKEPVLIAELANFHGGDVKFIFKLLEELKKISYPHKAVKFQPFRYDQIALPDFEWYPVYEKLFIGEEEWGQIIAKAEEEVGSVWLDLFDLYGVKILQDNISKVSGIKLQASVLDNHEVVTALTEHGLKGISLMLNISGYELEEIEQFVERFSKLDPENLILQIGYQRYPTEIKDTALNKIGILQQAFPGVPLCFADHASAEDSFAQRIPLLAASMGCEYIEKHVCLSREQAEYDFYSALEPQELAEVAADLLNVQKSFSDDFVSGSEADYLVKSYQAPVLKHDLPAGALVAREDLIFRRTYQKGLMLPELDQVQSERKILAHPVKAGQVLHAEDFRKANIAVIVACRMKSSRLKQKAILPIAGVPSVERCLQNCLMIPHADQVILATSTEEEDALLKDYTLGGKVKFWKGDPDDVIMRYLGACEEYGVDIIIRVTADCPVVSPEIAELLLDKHFQLGADYSAPREYAVGSNSEIYNVAALKRVIELLGKADYSEYMTWYMQNNPDVFKVNMVDLPKELVRDYRLTLDYPEDLELFERLYAELAEQGLSTDLGGVFKVLDDNPEIPILNGHLTLKYKTDQVLIDKLNQVTRIKV